MCRAERLSEEAEAQLDLGAVPIHSSPLVDDGTSRDLVFAWYGSLGHELRLVMSNNK